LEQGALNHPLGVPRETSRGWLDAINRERLALGLLAAILVATEAFAKNFSVIGIESASLFVTEIALVSILVLLVSRFGVREIVRTVVAHAPVVPLVAFWILGVIAAVRGLSGYGISPTLEDIGLLEYSVLLPIVIVLAAGSRGRSEFLVRALVIGGLAALLCFGVSNLAARQGVATPSLVAVGGMASAMYIAFFVSWVAARATGGVRVSPVHWVLVPLALVAIGLTDQRGAWLALVLSVGVVAILAPGWKRRLVALVAVPLALFVCLAGAILVERVLGPPVAVGDSAAAAGETAVLEATAALAGSQVQQELGALANVPDVPATPSPPAAAAGPAGSAVPGSRSPSAASQPGRRPARDKAPPSPASTPPVGTGESSGEAANLAWRLAFWQELVRRSTSSPLLGVGFGTPTAFTWGGVEYDFRTGDAANPFDVTGPHNDFIQILYRIGAPALLALLALIAVTLLRLRAPLAGGRVGDPERARRVALLGMFASALVAASFNDALHGPFLGIFFWTLLGLLLVEGTLPAKHGPKQP
jgi:O-Antigen ligase